uniref:ATP synthase complex subunit 8 n=1 Tax=Synapturanus sp. MHNL 19901 TaxID=2877829 RepID=A0A8K1H662_9NEOB|nr:ATP synthase F0 subunit 8 [Synapturanus sp. MHNL 19901]
MPQLTPDPWFTIFIICWLVTSTLPAPKILQHLIHNNPSPQHHNPQYKNWTWPWP